MSKRSIKLVVVIFIMTLLTGAVISCSDSKAAEQGPMGLTAPYIQPSSEQITDWDEYIGRFEASERVEVRSRVNGYVESVKFKDGDIVKKGQVLFIIDQRPFIATVQQAKAEKLQAEADLQRTRSDYDRIASVQDSRAVSSEEVEQRKQIAKSAEARLMAANARLSQAQLDLSYTEIKAPISGKISEDFVDPGNYISGGAANATLLTTILTINPIHFYFEASEADFLDNLETNENEAGKSQKSVLVKLTNENSYNRSGVIDFVDNEIHQTTGTIRGRAVFENNNMELESGMFGRLRVIGKDTNVILIPDDIISTSQSQKIVFTIGADSTVQVKPIQVGKLYQQKYRIVTDGLSSDDKIISGNLLKVRPGMKVIPEQKPFKVERDTTSVASL